MEEFQGGFLPYPEDAKLIQVDIDPFELGRNWEPDVAIQADARQAIDGLAQALQVQGRGVSSRAEYVDEITSGRREAIATAAADAEAALDQGDMPLKGKSIVHEINQVFGDNTILVKENGGQDLWAYYWPYYQVLDPGCCVPPAEQTAMGYGVVGAMGRHGRIARSSARQVTARSRCSCTSLGRQYRKDWPSRGWSSTTARSAGWSGSRSGPRVQSSPPNSPLGPISR